MGYLKQIFEAAQADPPAAGMFVICVLALVVAYKALTIVGSNKK